MFLLFALADLAAISLLYSLVPRRFKALLGIDNAPGAIVAVSVAGAAIYLTGCPFFMTRAAEAAGGYAHDMVWVDDTRACMTSLTQRYDLHPRTFIEAAVGTNPSRIAVPSEEETILGIAFRSIHDHRVPGGFGYERRLMESALHEYCTLPRPTSRLAKNIE